MQLAQVKANKMYQLVKLSLYLDKGVGYFSALITKLVQVIINVRHPFPTFDHLSLDSLLLSNSVSHL